MLLNKMICTSVCKDACMLLYIFHSVSVSKCQSVRSNTFNWNCIKMCYKCISSVNSGWLKTVHVLMAPHASALTGPLQSPRLMLSYITNSHVNLRPGELYFCVFSRMNLIIPSSWDDKREKWRMKMKKKLKEASFFYF